MAFAHLKTWCRRRAPASHLENTSVPNRLLPDLPENFSSIWLKTAAILKFGADYFKAVEHQEYPSFAGVEVRCWCLGKDARTHSIVPARGLHNLATVVLRGILLASDVSAMLQHGVRTCTAPKAAFPHQM